MKEYDIFIPLFYNDGQPIDENEHMWLRDFLLDNFDGYTFFPQPNKGFWRYGGVTYLDEIVVYRVVTADAPRARICLKEMKTRLKRDLHQEEIFIVEREVERL